VAIVNDGEIADDFEFSLAESPFAHLLGGSMCIFPSEIQVLFPEDYLLADLSLDAFAGLPLFKDGKIIGCLVALYRQPIEDSVFADHALHFFASRVAAELERKQSFDRLKEYESFLFGIVDLIEDVLFVADLQGRIKLVSNSAVNLFGWLPREMAGESFADYLTDDTRQLGIQEFEKHITSVLPRLCIKLKIKDKSGTIHPIVWSALTTRINNETSSCVGIIRKITNAL